MPIDNSKIDPQIIQRVNNSNIFTTIWAKAAARGLTYKNTADAATWFRNKAKELGKTVKPEDLMFAQEKLRNEGVYGKMYHYFYVPKYKDDIDKLPYYDIFPLIFMVGPAKKGFYGINLHYIPPILRAKLLDALFEIKSNDRFTTATKLNLTYDVLKGSQSYAEFRPCFKHYLSEFVYSRFMLIDASEWNIALFLPTERFVRSSKQAVWRDSRKIIAGL